jgi:hypothetical protein
MEASDMQDESDPTIPEAKISAKASSNRSRDRLQEKESIQVCISRLAERLRHAGYTESAHFMDIAALALQEPSRN